MQPSIQKLQLVSYSYNMNSQLPNYNKACKYTRNNIICDQLWENPPVTYKYNFKQFNILNYLKLSACNTRSSNIKLLHTRSSNNTSRHFYFNRLPQLWNALLPIDHNLPINSIKSQVMSFLWNFLHNFDSNNFCTDHFLCSCNSCMVTPHAIM